MILSTALKNTHLASGEFEVMEDIYSKRIKSDILIIGSSRAWTHFNSQLLEEKTGESVYNLGIDGHTFRLQLLRYNEFILHNKPPKKVILSIEAATFEQRDLLYQGEQFLPYMLYNDSIQKYLKAYNAFNDIDYRIPLIRYIGQDQVLKTILTNFIHSSSPQEMYRYKGFHGQDRAWNDDFQKAKKEKPVYNIKTDKEIINLFCEFIADCQSQNIQVFLVYSPEYIDGQNYIRNRAEMMNIFDSIAITYKVPLIDYSDDPIVFEKRYFYNANHMNYQGANLFSDKLADTLINITHGIQKNNRRS